MISVKINFSVCKILFGIFNNLNNHDDVFIIINLIILLGQWFLNSRRSSEYKLESIRVCHTFKDDLEAFNSKFGRLYDKL